MLSVFLDPGQRILQPAIHGHCYRRYRGSICTQSPTLPYKNIQVLKLAHGRWGAQWRVQNDKSPATNKPDITQVIHACRYTSEGSKGSQAEIIPYRAGVSTFFRYLNILYTETTNYNCKDRFPTDFGTYSTSKFA